VTPTPGALSRRRFLAAGGAVAGTTLLGSAVLAACGGGEEPSSPDGSEAPSTSGATTTDAPPQFQHLDDVQGLAAIGAAYLLTLEPTPSRGDVEEELGLEPDADAEPVTPAALLTTNAAQIHEDLVDGDVVEVDGWVLSTTEARISALAAFDAGVLDGQD
jgi:hypothetical protein